MLIYIICNRGINSLTTKVFHLSTIKVPICTHFATGLFVGVGGGGRGTYLKKGDQIFNVGMIRYASPEDTQGIVFSLRST